MRARVIFLAAWWLVWALAGCGDDATGPLTPNPPACTDCLETGTGSALIPLETGNYWIYDYCEYDSSGQVTHDATFRVEVIGTTWLKGAEWYQLRYPYAGNHYLARNCPSGYCTGEYWTYLQMQYSSVVSVGEEYGARSNDESFVRQERFTYVGDSAGIGVPAGALDCRFYVGRCAASNDGHPVCCYDAPGYAECYSCWGSLYCCGSSFYSNHWVAAGVGIVKMESWADALQPRIVQRWVLKETNVTASR